MDNVALMLISIIVVLVIFLIAREIVCWYWKINQAVYSLENIESLLEEITDKLDKITDEPEEGNEATDQEEDIIDDGKTRCPECRTPYDIRDYRKDASEILCSACKTRLK